MEDRANRLLHTPVLLATEHYSNRVAVVEESGLRVTYHNLNKLVSAFTKLIKEFNEKNDSRPFVGILSSVNHLSISAILGILNAGCTYIPLDEQSPQERLNSVVDNVNMKLLLADGTLLSKYPELIDNNAIEQIVILGDSDIRSHLPRSKTVYASDLIKSAFNDLDDSDLKNSGLEEQSHRSSQLRNGKSDDLAYILHSSGSTGKPKGIMLSHSNARAFTDWMQTTFSLTCHDIVMSRAPLKFDLSVFDVFNTLSSGATLVCFDWNKKRSSLQKHRDYVSLLEREQVSILYTTPSTLITLHQRGGLGQNRTSLRQVMYAGEPFPVPQLRSLMESLPDTRFANIYGPTETNIITCFHIGPGDLDKHRQSIPLGTEADHSEILVIDDANMSICHTGEVGELWCSGPTVCQGYLNRPDLTRKSLVESPFFQYPGQFWRTGDYGFRDDQGVLHYRGRRDHMVKIKGYRVELGEIESALAGIAGMYECCVVTIENHSLLYCFYSTVDSTPMAEENVMAQLQEKLPAYMIPAHYIYKPDLPKTSSGKIDRILLGGEASDQHEKQ